MRRPSLLLPFVVVGTLLLSAALPAVLAKGGESEERAGEDRPERGRSSTGREDSPARGRGGDDNLTESEVELMRPGPSVGMFRMERNSRLVHGEHVTFAFNETGVQDFSAGGVVLFDLLVPGGSREARALPQVEGEGAELDLRAATFRFKAHDNPAAVVKLRVDGAASFVFEPAARLVQATDDRVDFVVGEVAGSLRADDVRLQGQTVTVRDEALLFLRQARGGFDQHRDDISNAIGKGHVGVEATLGKRQGTGDLVEEVVSYGNVTMTTLKAEKGNLTLAVEGHGAEGRVLVLNVDGRILGAARSDDLTILMDNVSMAPASSLADVLDPDNDGFMPEYYVVFDPTTESFQLLVSVPHYSVHILSVTTPIALPAPSVVVGILAGVALLVPGAYVLFRRKE
jgi:hypothetical protein